MSDHEHKDEAPVKEVPTEEAPTEEASTEAAPTEASAENPTTEEPPVDEAEEDDEYQDSEAKSEDDADVEEEEEEEEEDDEEEEEEEKEMKDAPEQPVKRKRGRPPGSGKKKPPKSGRFQPLQIPLDEEGRPYDVENDELMLPEDPAGEEKVDKLGVLKGGREFRIRTFTILGRGQRMYMLATEPARCIGFRDSYLLFQRHRRLLKVKLTDDEKFDLIDRELIPHSYKGRTLGVVTARSIFREFGARVIVGGRRVVDDYNEAQAIAEGHTADELADPDDYVPPGGQEYDKNQYVAWYSGPSQVNSAALYENNLKSVLQAQGGPQAANGHATNRPGGAEPKADPPLDPQLAIRSASQACRYNKWLAGARRKVWNSALQGNIHDQHTNVSLRPLASQPYRTHVSKLPDTRRGGVVVTTVLDIKRRKTGLDKVDPTVWESASPEIKHAIEAELSR